MRRTSAERGCFAFVCVCSFFIMKATYVLCVAIRSCAFLCLHSSLRRWRREHSVVSLLKRGFTCDVSSMSCREALWGDL